MLKLSLEPIIALLLILNLAYVFTIFSQNNRTREYEKQYSRYIDTSNVIEDFYYTSGDISN